jgi:serine/threonine protein phosphatase PrpC
MKSPQATSVSTSLKWSGCTDRGKVRPNNEDSFLGLRFNGVEVNHLGKCGEASIAETDFAFAVSDGMGGAKSGEYASRIAIEKITTMLPHAFKQSAAGFAVDYDGVLTELFSEIHKALAYLGASYEECHGMEATLSLCWFTPGWMHFGHIGDSRVYYLPANENKIKQLSQDDTHVGWLFRNGQLNEREARNHPRRNVLQKALGGGNQFVDPQLGAVGCESGDIFLLTTDGLIEGLYDETLVELLRETENQSASAERAQRLVKEAVERSGRDNTTALVIQIG